MNRLDALREFLHDEAVGGVALLAGAIAALIWANVSVDGYESFWHTHADVAGLDLDLRHWINDGLMAVFFFVVGLEIKRELVAGELRDRRAALLPVLAAAGGVALPALLFVAITAGTDATRGWALPAATDIAFAVGVLALLGSGVPSGAKLYLLTIAIVDDIAAIAIIAVFYSHGLALGWLLVALGSLVVVALMRRAGVPYISAYLLIGAVAWLAVHESGVHATIAGVALGLMTPARPVAGRDVLVTLEHRLHPWSSLAIVPVFALANAGVALGGGAIGDALRSRLAWGVVIGLLVGKTLGIAGGTFLGLRRGWGTLPAGVTRAHVWGLAMLGGIGFTVSLFIAQLAFDAPQQIADAKIGILAGSVVSAAAGAATLRRLTRSS
ncbi:Na(+)/H(+) antiporter NhaA [Baekduia alba]|uniref:Na+/H+ antiporter NhaA n=1 Tax=Baekduia alba TaxID=2997333 RepID=UPI0023417AC2|nr:Na+/H+ antiporter NhaA [Baekduia alba]WCB91925.1 Na(+)/H(+) antiporter NhaA [Baekduia alba]